MSAHVREDFEEFVQARWEDLEVVAVAATMDTVRARETTAGVFRKVRAQWAELSATGSPSAASRGALLAELTSGRARRAPFAPDEPPGRAAVTGVEVAAQITGPALLDAWAGLPQGVRAVLAAEVIWGLLPDELAAMAAGAPLERGLVEGREVLRRVHRRARDEAGLDPADGQLEGDLAGMLRSLPTSTGDRLDLVRHGRGRARRRSLLWAGGLGAVVGGLAWWALTGRETDAAASKSWKSTSTWPARGDLVREPAMAQFLAGAARPGSRLLYAGNVEDRVAVVVANKQPEGLSGTLVQAWVAPLGATPGVVDEVDLWPQQIEQSDEFVAIALPGGSGPVLLVLARPEEPAAQLSRFARPTPDGMIEREWAPIALAGGVGIVPLSEPTGPAAWVQLRGAGGALPAPQDWGSEPGVDPKAVLADAAAITGFHPDQLDVRVERAPVPAGVQLEGDEGAPLEMRLVVVTTPDGGVMRTFSLGPTGDRTQARFVYREVTFVVPAAEALRTQVSRVVDRGRTGGSTYLVFCPEGGDSVQLARADGTPLGEKVALVERAAVVQLDDPDGAGPEFHLMLWDGDAFSERGVPLGRRAVGILGEEVHYPA